MTNTGFDLQGPDPSSKNTHTITADRLLIDLPTQDDAEQLFELVGGADREAVTAQLLWDGPADVAELRSWIRLCHSETFGEWGYHWVIRDRSGDLSGTAGQVIGAIGTRPTGEPGRGDVGYWLGKDYWSQGIMTEALIAVLQFGFEHLQYAKIEAEVFQKNERGIRLVESIGMRREGEVTRARRKNGEWIDVALFGVIPEDLAPSPPDQF
jgi:RimJ/RimL family protein N-acetyltransferase